MTGFKRSTKWSTTRRSDDVDDENAVDGDTEVDVVVEEDGCGDQDQPPKDSATDRAEGTAGQPAYSTSIQGVPSRSLRIAFALLSGTAMLLAGAAGYLKWYDDSIRAAQAAQTESVKAATETTVKMLSYRPDTVENDLAAARDQLTGAFRDSYTQLTNDVVIPGSKEKRISAVATVAAASSVSASGDHAVVLVFINQSIVVGDDPPSNTSSSARVTLDKVDQRWLMSDLTPI